MATPKVTRTFTRTDCTCKAVSLKDDTVYTLHHILPHKYTENTAALLAVKEAVDNDETQVLVVTDMDYICELRGMTEEDFIKYSEVLPPRGKKADTDSSETISESDNN